MKREVRFLGIDDSPFRFGEDRTRIIGVVTRGAQYVEGVLSSDVAIDGTDATDRVAAMANGTRFRPLLRAVFLNGVTLGGFNIVDLDRLWSDLRIPVVAVVRNEPDAGASERALLKHFPDGADRARRLRAFAPLRVPNGRHAVWINARGLEDREIPAVLALATVRGAIPEALRLAHVIGSGVARGESRGPV